MSGTVSAIGTYDVELEFHSLRLRQAHVTAITSDAFLGRPVIRIIRDCRSERGASILPPEVKGLVPVLRVPIWETDGYEIRCSYVRAEHSVRVQCLRCGHVGVLTAETLSRLAITPSTPIAAFVKRLRCRRCGSQSVLATRKPANRPQRAS